MVFHTALLLINDFTSLHGIHWYYHVSPPSRSSWFDRIVEWPFEHFVTVLPQSQYVAGQGQGSPEVCICSESVPNIWSYFSQRQNSQVLESNGVEMRVASLTITPDDRLAEISLQKFRDLNFWSEISRVQWCGVYGDIPSKVQDKLFISPLPP